MTLGAQCVGPRNVFMLDEITTGLDSSTAYLIVKAIRNIVHMTQVCACPPAHAVDFIRRALVRMA